MARYDRELATDARVIELIKMIAEMHNVVVEINVKERWCKFHCGEKKKLEIAKDIAIYFDKVNGREV